MYITVLEDDLALQRAIINALKMAGHKVVGFENSSLLIENLDVKTELYLLDINVDGINGLELLELLKRENPNVKVIIKHIPLEV
ncbi:hypothetical protein MNB_SM-7-658 [hydrothermal vent metagenome]|uniref:Response regulatory domain-containing protein n=1 Tax=hydrothermal vent metagenome TaxID=652676 RepID=A0A1W1BMP9_9ZZZZ